MRLLLAEPVELIGRQAALEERPGIHTGGGVPLVEDLVAATDMVVAAEEVIAADFVKRR